jgi:hypothetical protein
MMGRHCEQSEAIHTVLPRVGAMDCFALLAMTVVAGT